MKLVLIATALMVGIAAHAGTEIGYANVPLRTKAVFNAGEVRNFAIASVKVANEAAQVQTVTDQNCIDRMQYAETTDDSQCITTKATAKRAVVKVTVSYDHVAPADADAAADSVVLSVPSSSFTPEQLASIKNHVQLSVQSFTGKAQVVDQDNSPGCTAEDNSQCQPLVYKSASVREVLVSVQAK